MFINARCYMCWQEEKVEVPRLRISASPVTSQVTESAPWMENMMESVGYNDWCPLEIITKKVQKRKSRARLGLHDNLAHRQHHIILTTSSNICFNLCGRLVGGAGEPMGAERLE